MQQSTRLLSFFEHLIWDSQQRLVYVGELHERGNASVLVWLCFTLVELPCLLTLIGEVQQLHYRRGETASSADHSNISHIGRCMGLVVCPRTMHNCQRWLDFERSIVKIKLLLETLCLYLLNINLYY